MADDSIVAEYRLNADATKKALDDIIARLGKVEQETKATADRSAKEQEKAAARAAAAAAKAAKEQEKAANQAARSAEKAAKETENANTKAARQAALEAQKAAQAQAKAAQEASRAQAKAAQEAANAQKKAAQEAAQAQQKNLDQIKSTVTSLAATMGVAFGIQEIASFAKEAVELAGKVEGVQIAFNRLNQPKLLDELRKATKGTVSDLNLMTAAVRASNFQIPMEQMGSLLEFARRRAKETGESIDYLVESIVVGIGRKSPLILDNLGISAIELRKRFNGISVEAAEVGDVARIVGDIATEELEKMGIEAETTGDKIARIKSEFDNAKAAAGEFFIVAGASAWSAASLSAEGYADAIGLISGYLNKAELDEFKVGKQLAQNLSYYQKIAEQNKLRNDLALVQQQIVSAEAGSQREADLIKKQDLLLAKIEGINAAIEDRQRLTANVLDEAMTPDQVEAALKKYNDVKTDQIRNVAFLTAAIKALKEEQEGQGTSVERVKQITQELIPLQAELDALLGKTTKTVKEQKEEHDNLAKSFEEGIKKYQEAQIALIDLEARRNRLYAMRVNQGGTPEQEKALADELINIERQRLEAVSAMKRKFGMSDLDEQIALQEMTNEAAVDNYKQAEEDYKRFLEGIDEDHQKGIDIRKEREEKFAEFERELQEERMMLINGTAQFTLALIDNVARYEMQIAEQRYQTIDRLLKDGVISEEQAEQKKKSIAREQAKRNKEFAIFSAVINTAMAVVNALATAPNYIVGAIFSALAAIEGGIQIAAIEAQPLPQFAKGGWVDGKPHSLGGTKIEAEKGEFIINRKAAAKHAPLIEAINDDRIPEPQQGWDNLMQSIKMQAMFNDRNMIAAIDRHREAEKGLLSELLYEVKKSNGRPLRGGYHA